MAQQDKTTLQSAINTQLADNTSGDISAADVRDNLINITDSLLFNSGSQYITGSLTADSFTGSLEGTAQTASYVETAQTASYVETAQTASYVENAQTASYVETAQTASYVENAQTASYYQETDPIFTEASGTFVLTSSFDAFTSSYSSDSSSFDIRITDLETFSSSIDTIFVTEAELNASTSSLSSSFANEIDGLASTDEQTIELDTINNVIRLKETVAAPDSGTRTFEGNIIVTGSLTVTGSILVSGSIIPDTDGVSTTSSFDLGSPTAAWKDIYVSEGTINFLDSSGNVVSTVGTGNNQLTGDTFINGKLFQGNNVTASGLYSHAEGSGSRAWSQFSHAEGINTYTYDPFAPLVTSNEPALGSHAEGEETRTVGRASHAEGYQTFSSGSWSHAEGYLTTADGIASHAEGLGTVTAAPYQHASGKFNLLSFDENDLFAVGNGTSDGSRSNALTVKMSGSIALPTTQSSAPSWTGVDGEMVFATVTGNHYFYVWMAGAWRSGSLA